MNESKKKDEKSDKEELDIGFVMKYSGLGLLVACFFYFSQKGFNYRFLILVIVALALIIGSLLLELKKKS